MEEVRNSSNEQTAQGEREQAIEDLELGGEVDGVTGGRLGDPDEGGQVVGGVTVNRLAGNSNETLVEDDA